MANPFVHVELHTPDLGRAKEFYGNLFGWKLVDEPMPGGGSYTMIQPGEGTGGGMYATTETPPAWLAYVAVEDIGDATARARSLGAKIVIDGQTVGEFGWMTVFTDPTGAMLAMWQPRPMKT